MRNWNDDCLQFALEEPLGADALLGQLLPLSEREVECVEALCEAASPGPWVVDDVADGAGVVVATLPDGRHLVSLAPSGSPDDPEWVRANARLLCGAQHYLRRLLDDRRRWQQERRQLLERIESLEAAGAAPRRPR